MIKRVLKLDEEALAEAAELLGTRTEQDTVDAALRTVADQLRRAQAFAGLVELAKTGQFDELRDKRNYRSGPGASE